MAMNSAKRTAIVEAIRKHPLFVPRLNEAVKAMEPGCTYTVEVFRKGMRRPTTGRFIEARDGELFLQKDGGKQRTRLPIADITRITTPVKEAA